jgi:hypothetical protein
MWDICQTITGRALEAEESSQLEAVVRKRLMKTQKAG